MFQKGWLLCLALIMSNHLFADSKSITEWQNACSEGLKGWDNINYLYVNSKNHPFLLNMKACQNAYAKDPDNDTVASGLCYGHFLQKNSMRAIPYCLKGYPVNPSLTATVLAAIYIKGAKPAYVTRARFWLNKDPKQEAVWTMRLNGQALRNESPEEAMKWFALAGRKGDLFSLVALAKLTSKEQRFEVLDSALVLFSKQKNRGSKRLGRILNDILDIAIADGKDTLASLYDRHKNTFVALEKSTETPWDSFLGMVLAMEYAKMNEHEAAFDRLNQLDIKPKHVTIEFARELLGSQLLSNSLETTAEPEVALTYGQFLLASQVRYGESLKRESVAVCRILRVQFGVEELELPPECAEL